MRYIPPSSKVKISLLVNGYLRNGDQGLTFGQIQNVRRFFNAYEDKFLQVRFGDHLLLEVRLDSIFSSDFLVKPQVPKLTREDMQELLFQVVGPWGEEFLDEHYLIITEEVL